MRAKRLAAVVMTMALCLHNANRGNGHAIQTNITRSAPDYDLPYRRPLDTNLGVVRHQQQQAQR